jgi:pyruvate/2-oxoglutarate dehydrogenase complex dihydrolipoamide dehydrogenase (E3) component
VTLLERRERLGGNLELWARLPGREHLRTLCDWHERRLAELGVDVRLATDAGEDDVLALEPEAVVVATGSRYARDGDNGFRRAPVPGWEQPFVHTPEDVLEGEAALAGTVVVLDEEGMHAAAGIAELAAAAGGRVELVTRHPLPGVHAPTALPHVLGRLRAAGVAVSAGTFVRAIGDRRVTLLDVLGGPDREVEVDAVVLATMRRPEDALERLATTLPHVYLIGDALAPRGLREATYEGHRFGRVIGEPDMPATVVDELFALDEGLRPAELA